MLDKIGNEIKGVEKPVKKFLKDFKAFAMQGNVLDMAVGVMIGGAFGKIVSSLVADIFMPVIGLITGGVELGNLFYALNGKQYASVDAATADGAAVLNYGAFLTNVIDFILIALCVFFVVKLISKIMPKKPAAPAVPTRECPYCKTTINAAATRCPDCTSEVTPTIAEAKTT